MMRFYVLLLLFFIASILSNGSSEDKCYNSDTDKCDKCNKCNDSFYKNVNGTCLTYTKVNNLIERVINVTCAGKGTDEDCDKDSKDGKVLLCNMMCVYNSTDSNTSKNKKGCVPNDEMDSITKLMWSLINNGRDKKDESCNRTVFDNNCENMKAFFGVVKQFQNKSEEVE